MRTTGAGSVGKIDLCVVPGIATRPARTPNLIYAASSGPPSARVKALSLWDGPERRPRAASRERRPHVGHGHPEARASTRRVDSGARAGDRGPGRGFRALG